MIRALSIQSKARPSAAALLFLSAVTASAAEHHGRVLANGLPLPGVTVTATQGDKKLVATTDSQGIFQFPTIDAGQWKLHMEMQGFRAVDATVTIPETTPTAPVELQMMPLAEVLASAKAMLPNAPAPVITAAVEKPAPKAKAKDAGDNSAPPPPPADSAASSEPDKSADGMLINGSENNAATSKYSLAQAFGSRRAGSKSLYTGSAGFQLSASPFDAKQYSVSGLQLPKPSYTQFTGIATIGGPIRIPHLFYNGPNFFVAYQWTRDNNATNYTGLVPTADQRNGIVAGTIVNPATGLPVVGPVPISQQAAALLALYPLPNVTGNTSYNYQTQALTGLHADALQSRLDKTIGRRDSFFGGFGFRNLRSDSANLFQFRDTTRTLGIDTNVHWQHRFPHQLFVDTGYRFTRLRTNVTPYFSNRTNISGNAGITGNNQDPTNWGPPTLAFSSGIAGLTDGISAFDRNRTDELSVEATWTHRRHTVTFGGGFRRQESNQLAQSNPRGNFTFTGAASGSDFADFLLGVPSASRVAFGNADKYFRQSVSDLFVTDDWRIKPELTLTTGIRWDYGAPNTELKGRLVNLDVAPGFTNVQQVLGYNPVGPLTGQHYPSSLVRPDFRKFQPRFAFAWRPLPAQPLVIRGGYGIYVDTSVYLNAAESMSQQSPLSTSLNVSRSATCPLTMANGFINCAGTTSNTFAIDPNFRTGYAQMWNLSVQQDLPGSLVLTAKYLGSKGTHVPQEFLPNTYAPGGTATCASCPRGFVYRTSYANAIRHAGEVQLRRRLRSGITATLDYLYAHSIDNAAFLGGGGTNTAAVSSALTAYNTPAESLAQNWQNLRAERSRSSFDQRHLLKFTLQYTTGMGMGGGTLMTGWRGKLLKQWTIASEFSAGSGLPQTPIVVSTIPGTGFTNILRPNRTGADPYAAPTGYHLNSAAYATPANGQFGNAGRYSIEGPNAITLDTSLARVFKFRDPYSFELRVDSTNILNHVVYTGWVTTLPATTFGLPASAKGMRQFELSGRLRF
ncbi:TonB-dependent receptor [Terriglobus roseus]|uniref:Carboxypeptidase regulatory-like domain-containing protein n=1 Tax=Terriglobus roseus TaxID=392734 RepID=A0A1G7FMM9_9BACT|nr:carboxypeptidase regulatory-like domain-containing protein [Terriglobus roseus]SDE77058.1 Carboxypeptidase regulatory-like domain-containing protein [Terriglobus roseus]